MATMILGIDPGVTTGWAVLDTQGKIIGTGTTQPEVLEQTLDEIIRRIHRSEHEVAAAVEEFPLQASGKLASDLREVVATVNRVLHLYSITPFRVLPGQWKTSAVGIAPILDQRKFTVHERDAIRIGKYYLSRRAM